MKPGLSILQTVSKTSAAIVIVDGNTVTQAQVGDSRIVSFAKYSQQTETGLRVKESAPTEIRNRLGGQFFKKRDSTVRGDADVTDLSDVRFIVLGTTHFWFANIDTVAQIVSKNVNNLTKAAREITHLIQIPDYEATNGILVIGLNPSVTILAPERENKLISTKEKEFVPAIVKSISDKKVTVATRNRKKSRLLD